MSSSLASAFASLDLHPKVVSDFAVRTRGGGLVSLGATLLAAALFASELRLFLTPERLEHLEVDDDAAGTHAKMRVNFDVTFPSMPCAMLSVDALDASGSRSLDVLHDVFKRRLDAAGEALGGVAREEGGRTLQSAKELLAEKAKAIAEGRAPPPPPPPGGAPGGAPAAAACGNCYGAGDEGACCATCEDVREAYRRRGWGFDMKGIEQCSREGFYGDVTAQLAAREGCNVYGHLLVPKVPGNVHFAPGHGLQHAYAHTHDLVAFTHGSFNISHRVNALSFGPYAPPGAGRGGPLDGLTRTLATGSGMHQYFLKLVPTLGPAGGGGAGGGGTGGGAAGGAGGGGAPLTYQFSATEHLRRLNPDASEVEALTGVLPGVFFNYELSPLRVRVENARRSFGHFLTNLCAIVGGVYTVAGLVDGLLYRAAGAGGGGGRGGKGALGR